MRLKVSFVIDVEGRPDTDSLQEWLEFKLGEVDCLSGDNPMIEEDDILPLDGRLVTFREIDE